MKVFITKHYSWAFGIVCCAFLLPRLLGLGYDITNSDAPRWHRRSLNFTRALKEKDFAQTYQRYHPGVTLMWLGGFVQEVLFRYQLTFVYSTSPATLENADWYPVIHGISQGFLIIVLFILLLCQLCLISLLHTPRAALFYGFLVALEPYLIGINRWFHLTSLEVFLTFTAFLCLLLWLEKTSSRYLYISAMLLSLAVLTKISAGVVVPLFAGLLLHKCWELRSWRPLFLYFLVSVLILCLCFPALWVAPQMVISGIYKGITGSVAGTLRFNPYVGWKSLFYYPLILLHKLSPITMLMIFLSILYFRKNARSVLLLAYMLVIYIFYTVTSQKIDRYSIMFFPPILLLASVYLSKVKPSYSYIIIGGVVLNFFFSAYIYHPVYSAYVSPVLGGPRKALTRGLYENSGEYFSQAAQYLNELGRDTLVYVPDNIESFSYYYKGNLQREFTVDTEYVVYSLDVDRSKVTAPPNCGHIEKAFGPRNFDAVFVLSCEND
jgi:hypothetical protein